MAFQETLSLDQLELAFCLNTRVIYRKQADNLVGKLLRIPGMRALAGLATLLFSKHQAGIVVLRK